MTTALTLYSTEEQYLALLNTEDLVSPEQEAEFRAELADALKTAVEKRDKVAAFLRICRHHEDAIDTEVERLTKLKKNYVTGRERMQKYIVSVIEGMGTDAKGKYPSLKGETCVIGVRRGPGHIEVTDEAKVPAEYKTATVTMPAALWADIREVINDDVLQTEVRERFSVDKTAIKAAIEAGTEVTGADLAFGGLSLSLR
jgi:hypothetical protein